MKDGNLFHHEEQVLARAREVEQAPGSREELLQEFATLAREYGKLCRQSKSLVNISDMMQKDLNVLNERIRVANQEINHKNQQLEEYSRRLSEALESSQQKYRDIFDNAVEGIFRVATDGTILEANPAFARILGFAGLEQLLEELPSLERASMTRSLRERLLQELAQQPAVSGLRLKLQRRDGSSFVASISVRGVRDSKGALAYCEGLLADITRRDEVERAERERRAAEAASLAKSRFLAKMSHEIRTPMNAIIGLTESLLRSDLDEQQREHLGMVQDSGEHLLEIINDILDFAKLESGRVHLERIDFDLPALLQGCLAAMRAAAARKDLAATLRIGQDVPTYLRGDPGRLRQVLNNLLANAVKFTENGVVELSVVMAPAEERQHEQSDPEDLMLQFSVKDTGVGIAPENHERIFLDFTQSDDSTFRQYGGTGLGLSICRELVELMQGRIWVTSAPGVGSRFSFTAVFTPGMSVARPQTPPEPETATRPLRVLVVEDSPVNRTVTRLHLESLGHSVVEAEDGREALGILSRPGGVDLVLMDVEMPQMDGIETVHAIREGREGVTDSRIPVIAMTAHAFVEARDSCIAAGMDDYISKPVKRAELARIIDKVISGRSATSGAVQEVHDQGSEAQPGKPPVLDMEAARKSQGLTPDEFAMLFSAARKELRLELDTLARAFEDGDAEQAGRSAHTMKTVAASIGAMALSHHARELEARARSAEAMPDASLLGKLQADMETLERELGKRDLD